MDRHIIELVVIQLLFWTGMGFFLWLMKKGNLEHLEARFGTAGGALTNKQAVLRYAAAERLIEPMGIYQGLPIYCYAVIEGCKYRFDHILLNGESLALGARCLEPGLVYIACGEELNEAALPA